jgi:hypothetical protein
MADPIPGELAVLREAHFNAVCAMYPLPPDECDVRGDDGRLPRYLLVQGDDRKNLWHVTSDDWRKLLRYQQEDDHGWWPIAIWNLDDGRAWEVEIRARRGARALHEDVHAEPDEPPAPSIEELMEATGYHPEKDGPVDDLIAYKDALEDAYGSLLEREQGKVPSVGDRG